MAELILRMNGNGDGCLKEECARAKKHLHLGADAPPIIVGVLEGGMVSGRPSIVLGIELGDGTLVSVETSARLFVTAADAIRARYGAQLA